MLEITPPTPGEGHNVIGIDQSDFNAWVAKISAAESECKIANEKRNKLRKAMRADGIILGEFDAMRKLADLPRTEQIEKLTHSQKYLELLRSPVGFQFSLDMDGDAFDDQDDGAVEARVIQDAGDAGWRAGLAGRWEDENPHDTNSKAGQAWIGEYRKAQKQAAKALKG